MLFKKERSLSDKVFGTKVVFVDFGERDSVGAICKVEKELEAQLIEDFGAPEVELGGEYKAYAKLDGGKVVLCNDSDLEKEEVTLVLASCKMAIKEGFVAPFVVDAKKLEAGSKLTAEQIAEAKCLAFETEVVKRLTAAITALKAKLTTFETEVLDEVTIPVTGHQHS